MGIVTVDDAVEVMEQEATEDFEKMGGHVPFGKAVSENGRSGADKEPPSLAFDSDVCIHSHRSGTDGI